MKKIKADEYFNNGIFEMARFGRHTIIKNNMSEKQLQDYKAQLKSLYPTKLLEIKNDIKIIKEDILKCDPLQLLSFSADNTLMDFIATSSNPDKINANINRSTEFIQSIFVSSPSSISKSNSINSTENFQHIIESIDKLHTKISEFYFSYAENIKDSYPDIEEETIAFLMESQLMYLVRGKRYQIFEIDYYKNLLAEHNDIFLELFGIDSSAIINGIKDIQYSLSQGFLDSWSNIYSSFKKFQSGNKDIQTLSTDKEFKESIEKVFGTNLRNIAKVTNWPESLLKELSWDLNDSQVNFFNNSIFSGWPITYLPVFQRPFIKIDNQYYCFDYYIFIDYFYRVLQKTITRLKPQYIWSDNQQIASEKMVESIFKTILPNCITYTSNYYPINNSSKNFAENDLLVKYDEILIIVEVKAGSFIYTTPIEDFKNHIESYKSLIEKADHQCNRTLDYLHQNESAKIFNQNHQVKATIDMKNISKIYMLSVTIDNINTFAAKAEKLNLLKLSNSTISIGVDDLMAYEKYFDSPLTFLHFLEQRTLATKEKKLTLNDELDHLGMYIKHNLYPLTLQNTENYDRVNFHGYRTDLDRYFNSLYHPQSNIIKPTQPLPTLFNEIINWLDNANIKNRVTMANFLLNFSQESKEQLSALVLSVIKKQNYSKSMIPILSAGVGEDALRFTCFINQKNINKFTIKRKRDYTLASLYRDKNDDRYLIDLYLNQDNNIEKVLIQKFYKKDILPHEESNIKKLSDELAKERCIKFKKNKKRKIGRNELCPCGSGLKYKKCCLLNNPV